MCMLVRLTLSGPMYSDRKKKACMCGRAARLSTVHQVAIFNIHSVQCSSNAGLYMVMLRACRVHILLLTL